VLFLGREDGVLEVWDLQDRSQEASLLAHPCARAVASLAFSPATIGPPTGGRPAQQLLGVGAAPICAGLSGPHEREEGEGERERERERVLERVGERDGGREGMEGIFGILHPSTPD
jgi:hypothetical protein